MPLGDAMRRRESPRLLRGEGVFAADPSPDGLLHMAVLRSPHAHARVTSLDTSGVRARLCWTAADLPAAFAELQVYERASGQRQQTFPVLPRDRVVYAGQPLAMVVASSRYAAEDALEQIRVAYEVLPPVGDAEASLRGERLIYAEWGTNVVVEGSIRGGDAEAAFAAADTVVQARLRIGRSAPMPMECRGITAAWDCRRGELEIWYATQWPFALRDVLARGLGLADRRVRVHYRDVGGGFGGKLHIYPEDVLVPLAAKALGAPVRWSEDRLEHLVSAVHAREQIHDAALALRADGVILAVRDRIVADVGAHLHSRGNGPAMQAARTLPGPYRIPACDIHVSSVVTNKTPVGAYRGFGQPESAFVRERLLDLAARRLGLDPAEIRRRNLVQPSELPYRTCTGMTYDSGDYPAAFEKALELAGYEALRHAGRSGRGVGLAGWVEGTGMGPSRVLGMHNRPLGGYETAVVRMEPNGSVSVQAGVASQGQGQETTFAQICASELGVPVQTVEVVLGDTGECPYSSYGTAASRSAVVGGQAVAYAARKLRGRLQRLAAHLLEARPEDIDQSAEGMHVRGSPRRGLTYGALAQEAYLAHRLPPGDDPGLEERASYDPRDLTYTYGFDVAVVDVDGDTGVPTVVRYVGVHDCGVVINPAVAEGQVAGGVVQGLGGALFEELTYDSTSGQPLTGSLMDYLLPLATDVPAEMRFAQLCTPSAVTPTGVKGTGEGGIIAPAAALANAVADALGIEPLTVPLRPDVLADVR